MIPTFISVHDDVPLLLYFNGFFRVFSKLLHNGELIWELKAHNKQTNVPLIKLSYFDFIIIFLCSEYPCVSKILIINVFCLLVHWIYLILLAHNKLLFILLALKAIGGYCDSESVELYVDSKITMAGDVVPYYTVTALVPTLK